MIRIGTIVAGQAYPLEGFKLGLRDFGWVASSFARPRESYVGCPSSPTKS